MGFPFLKQKIQNLIFCQYLCKVTKNDFPVLTLIPKHTKHEIIACERCHTSIECKANAYTKCQCSVVQLSINEVQYISEHYDGCLCAKCLAELQQEFKEMIDSE